jgi:hypothetical protein
MPTTLRVRDAMTRGSGRVRQAISNKLSIRHAIRGPSCFKVQGIVMVCGSAVAIIVQHIIVDRLLIEARMMWNDVPISNFNFLQATFQPTHSDLTIDW